MKNNNIWLNIFVFVFVSFAEACGPDSAFIGDADNYRVPLNESPVPSSCPHSPRRLFNNGNSPYRGGEEQPQIEVNVVEDIQCPYCTFLSLDLLDLWQERSDLMRSVRWYFHHFPLEELHPGTTEIHVAMAAAAKQGTRYFWALFDALVRREKSGDPMAIRDVERFLARQADFDETRFNEDRNADEAKDFVQWDKRQASRAGVRGTPTVFICTEEVDPDTDVVEQRIDELLNK